MNCAKQQTVFPRIGLAVFGVICFCVCAVIRGCNFADAHAGTIQSPRAASIGNGAIMRSTAAPTTVAAPSPIQSLASATTVSPVTNRPVRVTLAWDASPDKSVTNYLVHWGVKSRTYTNSASFGTNTGGTISNLVSGTKYYFASTAQGNGVESEFSNEAMFPVPATNVITVAIQSSPIATGGFTNFLTKSFTNPPADAQFFRIGITSTNTASQILQLGQMLVVTNTSR